MEGLWLFHAWGIVAFLGVLLVVAALNLLAYPRPRRGQAGPTAWPKVTVLLPCRNEADNLGACLDALLAQDYPDYEIYVLDDHSTDQTWAILAAYAQRDARVRALRGAELPEGWQGKHWACQQLSGHGAGEYLLFVDADVRLEQDALRVAIVEATREAADLLSAIPRQELGTWGERLIVPYFLVANFAFIPRFLLRWARWPGLAFAIGQVMLFRRAAYHQVGGHAAVRTDAVDDIALARRIVASGGRLRLVDGSDWARCRMYHSWREAWDGFTKNMFAGLGNRVLPYVFVWTWSAIIFLLPLAAWAAGWGEPGAAGWAVGLTLLVWGAIYWRTRVPVWLALAYPATFTLSLLIAIRSLARALWRPPEWRGRHMARSRVHWL